MGAELMSNKTEHSKKVVLQALEQSLGVVTTACKTSGVSRTQFYEWMKTDEEFAQAVKDVEAVAIDFAESKLHQLIQEGNPASTIFFLKTKGKARGYQETQQLSFVEPPKKLSWYDTEDEE